MPVKLILFALAATLIFIAGCGQHDFSSIFGQQSEDELNDSSSSINSISNNASSSSRSIGSINISSGSNNGSSSSIWSVSGFSSSSDASCAPDPIPENRELMANSEEEMKLYELMMQYRAENGLPRIPISKSLNAVAKVHVRDLHENGSDFAFPCDMHSWSNKGNWTGCCFSSLVPNGACMWNKPSEITSYASYGYEIAIGYTNSGHAMNAETALNGWKSSPAHNAAIISEGVSENASYKAIGIGMYKEFAVTWFGEKLDECQDNCITLANGGLKPIENPQGECEGIEFKWCVAVNVYGSGMTACREIGEKLTYEECLQLSEHGFYPAEKPPINCARV